MRLDKPVFRGASFAVSYAELVARVAGRRGPGGRALCLWCENEVGPRRRVWCSPRCVAAYDETATWRGLRTRVAVRDRGVCALCRSDCRALRREYARLPKVGRAAFAAAHAIPKRRRSTTWWDADHIVPIAEGGAHTFENLRTLCLRCHRAETHALAARRAARRRSLETCDSLTR